MAGSSRSSLTTKAATFTLAVAAGVGISVIATAPEASAHTASQSMPTVKQGSRGDAVRDLQGHLRIKVDGVFGPQTKGAVEGFQRSKGLKVDGVVGPRTWAALAGGPVAAPAPAPAPAAGGKAAVVAFARAQIGDPYVWGATGPDRWDCSGLTQAAYRAAGISIPRVSGAQARMGTRVSNPAPGDLVVYPGHVAIYVGDGKMIAAPRPGSRVTERSVYGSPTFRRIG